MPLKLAALIAAAGALCVLLSTVFGVSETSEWLIFAAQGFFAAAIVIFAGFIITGILQDANAM